MVNRLEASRVFQVRIELRLAENRFNVVEQAVFLAVRNGYRKIEHLRKLFYIFSDDVFSSAVERLVNSQVLHLHVLDKTVEYSPWMARITELLSSRSYVFTLPESYEELFSAYVTATNKEGFIFELLKTLDEGYDYSPITQSIEFVMKKVETHE